LTGITPCIFDTPDGAQKMVELIEYLSNNASITLEDLVLKKHKVSHEKGRF
jgi:uncharacterized membrane protein